MRFIFAAALLSSVLLVKADDHLADPEPATTAEPISIQEPVVVEDPPANEAEGGDEVAAEGGDEVAAEGGDEVAAEGGDEVAAEGGDEVAAEGGDEVAAEEGEEVAAEEDGEEAAAEEDEAPVEQVDEAPVEDEENAEEHHEEEHHEDETHDEEHHEEEHHEEGTHEEEHHEEGTHEEEHHEEGTHEEEHHEDGTHEEEQYNGFQTVEPEAPLVSYTQFSSHAHLLQKSLVLVETDDGAAIVEKADQTDTFGQWDIGVHAYYHEVDENSFMRAIKIETTYPAAISVDAETDFGVAVDLASEGHSMIGEYNSLIGISNWMQDGDNINWDARIRAIDCSGLAEYIDGDDECNDEYTARWYWTNFEGKDEDWNKWEGQVFADSFNLRDMGYTFSPTESSRDGSKVTLVWYMVNAVDAEDEDSPSKEDYLKSATHSVAVSAIQNADEDDELVFYWIGTFTADWTNLQDVEAGSVAATEEGKKCDGSVSLYTTAAAICFGLLSAAF